MKGFQLFRDDDKKRRRRRIYDEEEEEEEGPKEKEENIKPDSVFLTLGEREGIWQKSPGCSRHAAVSLLSPPPFMRDGDGSGPNFHVSIDGAFASGLLLSHY